MYNCNFLFWLDNRIESRTGTIYSGDRVIFEERKVKPSYIAIPAFVNYHTHLGDSVAKDPPFSGIELVMPGGYKFKMIKKHEKDITIAMEECIRYMILSGTLRAFDFREGGTEGVKALKKADKFNICVILGRTNEKDSPEEILSISDGFGISSVRDVGFDVASRLRDIAKKREKLFFVHAGEVDSKDVDEAIDLKPDAIVHMNMAKDCQIKRAMDEEITIVSCIRSNAFFDLLNLKNYRLLKNYQKWRIGTDNVMLTTPSMFEEMHFASYLIRDDENVFRAATCEGLNFGVILLHRRLNLIRCKNTLAAIVRRAGIEDVECVIPGKVVFK